jgi:hypothetical protein
MLLCKLLVALATEDFLESAVRFAELLLEFPLTLVEFVNDLVELLLSAGFLEVEAVARSLQGNDRFPERREIDIDG